MVIFRSLLSKLNYYHNKRLQVKESQYFILTYNWTLTPIPNWTCSVVTVSPFYAQLPSTWLINCVDSSTWLQSPTRKGCWLQSSLVYPNDEDQEDTWSQNLIVHIYNNFFTRMMNYCKTLSPIIICLNKFCSMLVQLANTLMALKTILLYV